jgi:hypothetical protein
VAPTELYALTCSPKDEPAVVGRGVALAMEELSTINSLQVSELPKTATGKVQKYVLRGKPAISKQ